MVTPPPSSHMSAARNTLLVLCRTLLHAYRGYMKRMARDPIQLVHVFHNCATLLHFIIWATCVDGLDSAVTFNVLLLEFDDIVVSLMALSGWGSVLYYARGHPVGCWAGVGFVWRVVSRCLCASL